jgi:hypothetical protein
MLVLAVLGVALVSSVLTGGRLEYARNWQLKRLWMALGAFAVQTALFTQWGTGFVGEGLVPVVYVVTLSALVAFLVMNRKKGCDWPACVMGTETARNLYHIEQNWGAEMMAENVFLVSDVVLTREG